jgi:predicted SnoaL-like aldol condensation-catalyzing enzyme
MRKTSLFLTVCALALAAATSYAQEPVVGVANPDALFTDKDPVLHKNKQAAYGIVKVLIESGHWDKADQYLTERYIQHNPLAASGRDAVVTFFTKVLKSQPKPIPEKMATKVVAVVAQGDLVIVVFPRELKDPKDPSKTYTTTWFDMWRFVDGKADEHWDGATKNP